MQPDLKPRVVSPHMVSVLNLVSVFALLSFLLELP